MTNTDDRVVVYADYVCPFCRLGNATLREYLADRSDRGLATLDVEWRPFDLRNDERAADGSLQPATQSDKGGYVRSRWSEVASLAEQYGVEMTMNVDKYLQIDARNAQLVALGLKRDDPERFWSFHNGVFDALWTDTRDVGDPAVLRELVATAGGDPTQVERWTADEELRDRFDTATERATGVGVRGVPTVRYGDELTYGSQPSAAYRALLEGAD